MLIKIIEHKNVQTVFLFIVSILSLMGIKYIVEIFGTETDFITACRLVVSTLVALYMGAIIYYNRNI